MTIRPAEPTTEAPAASTASDAAAEATPAPKPGWRFNETLIQGVCDGFAEAGIDFVIYVPDSSLDGVEQRLIELGTIETYSVVREDDGIAMAMGAYMVGRTPAVLMEGAGVGMCGTVLARALVSRTPMLVLAGHSETLGEKFDYHSTARLVVASVPRALNLPHYVIPKAEEARDAVVQAALTVRGQKSPFVLMVPPYVFREG